MGACLGLSKMRSFSLKSPSSHKNYLSYPAAGTLSFPLWYNLPLTFIQVTGEHFRPYVIDNVIILKLQAIGLLTIYLDLFDSICTWKAIKQFKRRLFMELADKNAWIVGNLQAVIFQLVFFTCILTFIYRPLKWYVTVIYAMVCYGLLTQLIYQYKTTQQTKDLNNNEPQVGCFF